jgi:hypothetical protein
VKFAGCVVVQHNRVGVRLLNSELGDIRRMLKEQRIDIVPVLDELNRNPFESESGFEAFFHWVHAQLGDEAFIQRLTRGPRSGPCSRDMGRPRSFPGVPDFLL